MGIKDFFRLKQKNKEYAPTHIARKTRSATDTTESYQCNAALTQGLWHNTYPRLTLAAGLAHPIIQIPVSFMGLPSPTSDDEATTAELEGLVVAFATQMRNIHIQCHRDGTIWILPVWNVEAGRLVWEFIPDETVTDIIKDSVTGEIKEVWTQESMTVSTTFDKTATYIRKRHFTKDKLIITYSDVQGDASVKNTAYRNPLGVLPIPFANNADFGNARGHSDYERILPLLTQYHDLGRASAVTLAKFKPKLVVKVDKDGRKDWEKDDLDIESLDLMVVGPDDAVELLTPDRSTDPYLKMQEQIFLTIIESIGIPELFLGGMATGNHASVEESMTSLIRLVRNKQNQKNRAYEALLTASLNIQRMVALNRQPAGNVLMGWAELDAVSDKSKAEIFASFTKGIATAFASGVMTKAQAYGLWKQMFPGVTESTLEEYIEGIRDTAQHNQYNGAGYTEALDYGEEDEPEGDK